MTITEFLLARITEDEDELKTARIGGSPEWWEPAQWCRERAEAECAAKRAIVEMCPEVSLAHKGIEIEMGHGEPDPDLGEQILRTLAATYADHPDYQPEWKLDTPSEAG